MTFFKWNIWQTSLGDQFTHCMCFLCIQAQPLAHFMHILLWSLSERGRWANIDDLVIFGWSQREIHSTIITAEVVSSYQTTQAVVYTGAIWNGAYFGAVLCPIDYCQLQTYTKQMVTCFKVWQHLNSFAIECIISFSHVVLLQFLPLDNKVKSCWQMRKLNLISYFHLKPRFC